MALKLYSNFVNSAGERVRIALAKDQRCAALDGLAYVRMAIGTGPNASHKTCAGLYIRCMLDDGRELDVWA